jgi:hypothetical protein
MMTINEWFAWKWAVVKNYRDSKSGSDAEAFFCEWWDDTWDHRPDGVL